MALNSGVWGLTETVSMGMAPMAFSMSGLVSSIHIARSALRTAKATQPELVQLVHFIGKLAVVLNDIDVVGSGQQAGKRRGARIPQRRRNNGYTNVSVQVSAILHPAG